MPEHQGSGRKELSKIGRGFLYGLTMSISLTIPKNNQLFRLGSAHSGDLVHSSRDGQEWGVMIALS
jgi:hypothetical protein